MQCAIRLEKALYNNAKSMVGSLKRLTSAPVCAWMRPEGDDLRLLTSSRPAAE